MQNLLIDVGDVLWLSQSPTFLKEMTDSLVSLEIYTGKGQVKLQYFAPQLTTILSIKK